MKIFLEIVDFSRNMLSLLNILHDIFYIQLHTYKRIFKVGYWEEVKGNEKGGFWFVVLMICFLTWVVVTWMWPLCDNFTDLYT